MYIKINDLTPESCERLLDLYPWDNDIIIADSLKLSYFEEDELDDLEDISVTNYLTLYFKGHRTKFNGLLSDITSNTNISSLQKLDLAYRAGATNICQYFLAEDISEILNSRRAFVIAHLCLCTDIVEIFLESHSNEWLLPLTNLLPFLNKKFNISPQPLVSFSDELSAKKIGENYYIHQGSNYWNRAWLRFQKWDNHWDKQLNIWQNQFKKSELYFERYIQENFIFLIVPEKDCIARVESNDFLNGGYLPLIFIENISTLLKSKDKVLFPLLELIKLNNKARYKIPDSHLSGEDYWTIFGLILSSWGFGDEFEKLECSFVEIPHIGDLGSKFDSSEKYRQIIEINPHISAPKIVDGNKELIIPLHTNYLSFNNSDAPIKKSVLLLGDSHCSIGSSPFLTFLFASVFEKVSFYWNPYFLHEFPENHVNTFDFAICEIAQRFITPSFQS